MQTTGSHVAPEGAVASGAVRMNAKPAASVHRGDRKKAAVVFRRARVRLPEE